MDVTLRTSFEVASKDHSKSSLDELVRISRTWLSKKFPGMDLEAAGFDKGVEHSVDQNRLRSISLEQGTTRYFGFSLEHPDSRYSNLTWVTTLAAKESGKSGKGASKVTITQGNKAESTRLELMRFDPEPPKIISNIAHEMVASDFYRIHDKVDEFNENNIGDLVYQVTDSDRTIPLVLISRRTMNGIHRIHPNINPEKLAKLLLGLAHVATIKHDGVSLLYRQELKNSLRDDRQGEKLNCLDGAVKLYWPRMGKRIQYDLFLDEELGDPDFERKLYAHLANASKLRKPYIALDDILRLQNLMEIAAAKEGNDFVKIADSYAKDNETLAQQVRDRDATILGLKTRIQSMSESSDFGEERADSDLEIRSVSDAVNLFERQSRYKDRVTIHPKARNGAKKCDYKDPGQIYDALIFLATTYFGWRTRGVRHNIDELARASIDMEYKGGQSEITMRTYRRDYEIEYNGQKVFVDEHLGKGTGFNGERTIRIAFHYDKENKRVVVGYIGKHQINRDSN